MIRRNLKSCLHLLQPRLQGIVLNPTVQQHYNLQYKQIKTFSNEKVVGKIEIGLYLAHYSGMYCYNVSVLNIGLFQFSSQISVTLVSVLFTPPLVNPKPTTFSLENVFIYLFH